MSFPAEQKRTTDGKYEICYEKTIVLEIREAQVAKIKTILLPYQNLCFFFVFFGQLQITP